MDTNLLIELGQLCEQILNRSDDRKQLSPSWVTGQKRKKKDTLKLYTFANLLLCGLGYSFRMRGCPSQLEAEKLSLIIGEIVFSNTNTILESLYNDMIDSLSKYSLLSKAKLRKSFSYSFFVHTPAEHKLNVGRLRFCLNKLLPLDFLVVYPVTLGWISTSEICCKRMSKIVKDTFLKRDFLMSVIAEHKEQNSENTSSRYESKMCVDGGGDHFRAQEPIAEVSREDGSDDYCSSDQNSETSPAFNQSHSCHKDTERSESIPGNEEDSVDDLSELDKKIVGINTNLLCYSGTIERLIEKNRNQLCLPLSSSSENSLNSIDKAPTPKTVKSSTSSSSML